MYVQNNLKCDQKCISRKHRLLELARDKPHCRWAKKKSLHLYDASTVYSLIHPKKVCSMLQFSVHIGNCLLTSLLICFWIQNKTLFKFSSLDLVYFKLYTWNIYIFLYKNIYLFFIEHLFIKVYPILNIIIGSQDSTIVLWQLKTVKLFNRFCVIVLLTYL